MCKMRAEASNFGSCSEVLCRSPFNYVQRCLTYCLLCLNHWLSNYFPPSPTILYYYILLHLTSPAHPNFLVRLMGSRGWIRIPMLLSWSLWSCNSPKLTILDICAYISRVLKGTMAILLLLIMRKHHQETGSRWNWRNSTRGNIWLLPS